MSKIIGSGGGGGKSGVRGGGTPTEAKELEKMKSGESERAIGLKY